MRPDKPIRPGHQRVHTRLRLPAANAPNLRSHVNVTAAQMSEK